jgi:hypothetical protein
MVAVENGWLATKIQQCRKQPTSHRMDNNGILVVFLPLLV